MSNVDYDKCPKCHINPDSMVASCLSPGCPIWRRPEEPIMTQSQTELSFVQQPTDPLEGKVIVDREALKQVLVALNGPAHLIRELQVTRTLPPLKLGDDSVYENPINKLIHDYNVHVTSLPLPSTTTDQTKPE